LIWVMNESPASGSSSTRNPPLRDRYTSLVLRSSVKAWPCERSWSRPSPPGFRSSRLVGPPRYAAITNATQGEVAVPDVPVAISRLGEDDSREAQNLRAVKWLLSQPGGPVVVVTPQRAVESASIARLIAQPGVQHHAWRGHHGGYYSGHRVLQAWPDRKHLNDVWNVDADAIAVIEWSVDETAEWISHMNPVQLLPGNRIEPSSPQRPAVAPLPEDVDAILRHIAAMAAGYSAGLKWNEEDKLKADMMNRPDRWVSVTVEQIRARCHDLGMRGEDVDTISGYLQRRKEGRRFNVGSSYRTFHFN